MKAIGFDMFRQAIKVRCQTTCQRVWCGGCPFAPWSERRRQVQLFVERRRRIAAARRSVARAAAR